MVGFHIEDYCFNFIDCCQRRLGCRVDRSNMLVEHGGRTVRVRALPIGEQGTSAERAYGWVLTSAHYPSMGEGHPWREPMVQY